MSAGQPDCSGETSAQQPAEPFGRFIWEEAEDFVAVAADRSLGSALRRMRDENARWVIVVRTLPDSATVYYYAFRSSEWESLAKEFPGRKKWTIERAMEMHEWTSSMTSRNGRPTSPRPGQSGPAAGGRIIDFNALGHIVAIGEQHAEGDGGSRGQKDHPDFPSELGSMRGVREPRTSAPATEIEVTLSAQASREIQVGATESIDFRIELSSEAMPLAAWQDARAKADLPIVVSLRAENDVIEIVQNREHTVNPPGLQKSRGQVPFR